MSRKCVSIILILTAILSLGCYADVTGVLNPKGMISHEQRRLMFDTMALMLIVVLPVIVMSFAFAYRYRSSARRGRYHPDWHHNTLLEVFWWGIPAIIVIILAVITWKKTHSLDPYKPLEISAPKTRIEVVALRWKWLFIYPDAHIATINDLFLPANTQVEFYITADAPMSSFHIPQLGGQIYAMAGMRTRLHLYSSHPGTYVGLNTHINGEGFSHMHFSTHVLPRAKFKKWIKDRQAAPSNPLTLDVYKHLYEPTIDAKVAYFNAVPDQLFTSIMQQYTRHNSWLH